MQNRSENATDPSAIIQALQRCIQAKDLVQGKLIHSHLITSGQKLNRETHLFNTLLSMYHKCSSLADAQKVFRNINSKNECSWNLIISAHSGHGLAAVALNLFREMQKSFRGFSGDRFIIATVLSACVKVGFLKGGMEIHKEIEISNCFDLTVTNALIDMYGKCGGSVEDARQVFDKMTVRDAVSWTTMAACYAKIGDLGKAMDLFKRMPNKDLFAWTSMITGFAQNGLLQEARDLFDRMPKTNLPSWNAMISGYANNGCGDDALGLFKEMHFEGNKGDLKTLSLAIAVCADRGRISEGMQIHAHVIRHYSHGELIIVNGLIDMYAKLGKIYCAGMLFKMLKDPDIVSWTTLMSGYAQSGEGEEALFLFRKMQHSGLHPDSKTLSLVFSVCADLPALEQGIEIHDKYVGAGVHPHLSVNNALIDMYAKGGNLDKAVEIFQQMPDRNVITWTTMVAGYALVGHGKKALKLFGEMKDSGLSPDSVTILCLLVACNHAGLVEEAYYYFNSFKEYNLEPSIEHYACMVDLLGRLGRLDEALRFIQEMPVEPNALVWICLLSACRKHKNVELGNYVAERIISLNPDHSASYLLLSKIYAAADSWERNEKFWEAMTNRAHHRPSQDFAWWDEH